jgi:hypothetical protein
MGCDSGSIVRRRRKMIPRAYTGCTLVLMALVIGFTEVVVGCVDSPTVVGVQIVTKADGSWDDDTTPDAVPYANDVDLRAVVEVSGESHDFYWDYASAYVSGLGETVYRWDSDWPDPSIEWLKVMPDMDGQAISNDPWSPSYGYYTNVVSDSSPGTVSCPHTPSYSYSNPDAEPDSWDIIRYKHTQVENNAWSYEDSGGTASSVGTRHYTIVFELDGETYYSTGKEDTDTDSNLVVYGGYGGSTTNDDYSIGIRDRVTRVVRLSNATSCKFTNYIKSYEYVPWIYGSVSYQARDRIGFDCADLAAAAAYNADLYGSYTASASGLASGRSERGSWGKLKMSGSTVVYDSTGFSASVSIGTTSGVLNIGDLIMIDNDNDGDYDHTTVLYEDLGTSGTLDGPDKLIFAGHDGVTTLGLQLEMGSTKRFVLRVGWPGS